MKLVYFKMIGCGHCENFEPTWKAIEKKYNIKGQKKCETVVYSHQNSNSKHNNIVNACNVRSFPTLMAINVDNINEATEDKIVNEFKGQRTEENIENFMLDNNIITNMKGGKNINLKKLINKYINLKINYKH